ncbi:hypothetical protein OLZ67_014135 [Klebsiella oxytoca]|uniref:hypothetical protein n=2 Tax=Klebsiella oxytoca TaxID=571 RepID=UPI002235F3E5|nr:hypothetical protein [Klebsiella oxytoca]MCW4550558.1 hypothetical protein [Klebsiella oxytoca]MDU3466147.1 hypothetical protein [Klebsiella oxytoca]
MSTVKMKENYTNEEIAIRYGVNTSTVSREWSKRGFNIKASKTECDQWILLNIIQPLREDDTKKLIELERLRKLKAEADQAEIELHIATGHLIESDYVEETLTSYFQQLKSVLRSIPSTCYVQLFESTDALELKVKLEKIIDAKLNDIGNYEYESEQPEQDDEDLEQEFEGDSSTEED